MKQWRLSASHERESCGHAIDGNPGSRFSTGAGMRQGMWFRIDFDAEYELERIVLDTRGSPQDFPRGYVVEASKDGESWSEKLAAGKGTGPITDIRLPHAKTRHLRIRQTGSSDRWWWSIHELEVYGRPTAGR